VNAYSSAWLHCAIPRPQAPQRLICFPHAGGTAFFFREWASHLGDVELHSVRYPARAERIEDPPATDLLRLAADIAIAVAPLADRPVALFGHSMGAAIAFETARELERMHLSVSHLFASGSRDAELPPAPGDFNDDPDEVIRHLISLGGTDPDVMTDPIFRELVLPYIVSDSRMFGDYAMAPRPRIGCPVTTIVGEADADADRRPWHELTCGTFREVPVAGDHFYLIAEPPFGILREALAASTSGRTG